MGLFYDPNLAHAAVMDKAGRTAEDGIQNIAATDVDILTTLASLFAPDGWVRHSDDVRHRGGYGDKKLARWFAHCDKIVAEYKRRELTLRKHARKRAEHVLRFQEGLPDPGSARSDR